MATYNTRDTWYVNVWRYGSHEEPSFECSQYKHLVDVYEDITDGKDAMYEGTLIRKPGLDPAEWTDLETEAHKALTDWHRERMPYSHPRGLRYG